MANLYGIKAFKKSIQDTVIKETDNITDEIVGVLDTALENRRLIGYGGICKQKHKELNSSKREDDLIRASDGTFIKNENFEIERYRWDIGTRNYVRIKDEVDNEY